MPHQTPSAPVPGINDQSYIYKYIIIIIIIIIISIISSRRVPILPPKGA